MTTYGLRKYIMVREIALEITSEICEAKIAIRVQCVSDFISSVFNMRITFFFIYNTISL